MSTSSPAFTYVAIVAFSLCVGYFAGIGTAMPFSRSSEIHGTLSNEANTESDSEAEGEEVADGDLSVPKANSQEKCKLVLVVRSDLGMSAGKIAAQCSHATLACYKALCRSNPSLLSHWMKTGQTKIALRCEDEEELLILQAQAQSLNLCARTIQDAGRTQIAAGSRTVLGIGPAPIDLINQVTGNLKLL